jgi:cyclophilin family peptidyl-prolyl cis-trans isomerase
VPDESVADADTGAAADPVAAADADSVADADAHPAFGRVIDGMDVISKIEKVNTDSSDRPVTPVRMNK